MKKHGLFLRVVSLILVGICIFGLVSCDDEETANDGTKKVKKDDSYTQTFFFYMEDDNLLDHYRNSGTKNISTYKRLIRGDRAALINARSMSLDYIISDLSMENDQGLIRPNLRFPVVSEERVFTSCADIALGADDTLVIITSCPTDFGIEKIKKEDGSYEQKFNVYDSTPQYKVRLISGGNEKWSVSGENQAFGGCFTECPEVAVSDAGYVYLLMPVGAGGGCFRISPDGNRVTELELGLAAMEENHLGVGGDGLVRLWSNKYESGKCLNTIYTIDDETATLGKKIGFYGGDSGTELIFAPGYDAYYNYSGGLYGVNDGKYPVRLFDWFDLGISSGSVSIMSVIDDKTVYLIYTDDLSGEYKAGYMRDVPLEEYMKYYAEKNGDEAAALLKETKELTIVAGESLRLRQSGDTLSEGDLFLQCAQRFNRENMQYKISFKRVSGDSNTASGVLMRKMLSGEIPDLVLFSSGFAPDSFRGKKLFANLYDYIDKDEKYDREAFANCIFDVFEEKDGSLPFLTTDFRFYTLTGTVGNVGKGSGWSLEEFLDTAEKLPDGKYLSAVYSGSADPRREIFMSLFRTSIDRFIDYDSKTCDFDSELFRRLLKLCRNADISTADVSDHSGFAGGNILFLVEEDWSIEYIMERRAVFAGSDYNVIGFPTSGDESGAALQAMIQFGIPKNAENRDEAWNFIKYYLDAQEDTWKAVKESDTRAEKLGKIYSFPCTWDSIENMFYAARTTFMDVYFYEYADAESGKRMTGSSPLFQDEVKYAFDPEVRDNVYTKIDADDPERLLEFASGVARAVNNWLNTDEIRDSWVTVRFTEMDEKILRDFFEKPCVDYYTDQKTNDIVREEAETYFSGAKPIDEVVRIIQDRVTTRINE